MRAREASFSFGATASSRSKNTMSALVPGPFPIIFSDEPGIARQERRGRFRERKDMALRLHRASYQHLGGRWAFPNKILNVVLCSIHINTRNTQRSDKPPE